MDRATEIELLERCLQHQENGSTQLSDSESSSTIDRYVNPSIFERESDAIFRQLPAPYLHESELPKPNSFVTLDTFLGPLLVTRDENAIVRAFFNVCRHRGTQLVEQQSGCARRFSCPYHAWTYGNNGQLLTVPHGDSCFPTLDKAENSLVEISCTLAHGFLWLSPKDKHLDLPRELENDLHWLQMDDLKVFATDSKIWNANWKLIAEGGLESYHFRFAHRKTIAPYFMDNLSIVDKFGDHFRTVLPSSNLPNLREQPQEDWSLRQNSHIVYALFPFTSLLVEADHIAWIHAKPLSTDKTAINITSLIPKSEQPRNETELAHWQKNHDITRLTLEEDFSLAERIQQGLRCGANTQLRFGRNEGALEKLNGIVTSYL